MLIALNKPFGVLSQFIGGDGKKTLADYVKIPDVYPAGRLDHDSEGLLLLTDDGALQHEIAHPTRGRVKRYWAQVDGEIDDSALRRLEQGVAIGEGASRYTTHAVRATRIAPPDLPDRDPPIRVRRHIPTSWVELQIDEGRNRQVRRMTASVGYATLRLIRVGIGPLDLATLDLPSGRWRAIDASVFRET